MSRTRRGAIAASSPWLPFGNREGFSPSRRPIASPCGDFAGNLAQFTSNEAHAIYGHFWTRSFDSTYYKNILVSKRNVDGLGSVRSQEGGAPMPATSSRKVRAVESARHARRSPMSKTVARVKGRESSRQVGGVPFVSSRPAMARSLPSAKRPNRGGRGADFRARPQNVTAAETLVHLTPGQAVRITREFAELTQAELATMSGLTQATVSAIETGRTSLGIARAKRLALAMKVHPASLLFPANIY